jgi:hypothetical protein
MYAGWEHAATVGGDRSSKCCKGLCVAKREPPAAKKMPQPLGQQVEPARPFKRRPWLLVLSAVLVLSWILVLIYLAIYW